MNSIQEISFLSGAIAIASLLNWMTGDRSVLGRQLLIRDEPRWAAARWFGLGVWISTIVANSSEDYRMALAGLAGALILAFGTARKTIKNDVTKPGKTNGEQGVAPQPAARSESDFSGSLPPST
ncbi:MAG: hypothetical protein QNL33_19585 [Akkermansiaceae bacterium]